MVDSSQIRDGLQPANIKIIRIITTILQRLPPVGRRTRKITTASQQVFRPGWNNYNNNNGQKEYKDKNNNSGEKQGGLVGGEMQE